MKLERQADLIEIDLHSWTCFKHPLRILLDLTSQSVTFRTLTPSHYRVVQEQGNYV